MSDATGKEYAPGVKITNQSYWYNEYLGTAEALVAAGLVRADQLPGLPGLGTTRTTFYGRIRVKRGASNPKRDKKYLSVTKIGKKFRVVRGASVAVQAERQAERQAVADARDKQARALENVPVDAERMANFMRGYRQADAELRRHPITSEKRALPAGWRVIVNPNRRLDGPNI